MTYVQYFYRQFSLDELVVRSQYKKYCENPNHSNYIGKINDLRYFFLEKYYEELSLFLLQEDNVFETLKLLSAIKHFEKDILKKMRKFDRDGYRKLTDFLSTYVI